MTVESLYRGVYFSSKGFFHNPPLERYLIQLSNGLKQTFADVFIKLDIDSMKALWAKAFIDYSQGPDLSFVSY